MVVLMRLVFGIGAILQLTACLPLNTYYREGAQLNKLLADETNCEVDALAKAPVANEIRRDPPRFVRGQRICKPDGSCYDRPGYFVSGEIYTVDVNAPLRQKVERLCMAEKGYAPVQIPACPGRISEVVPPRATKVLPRLTEGSCVCETCSNLLSYARSVLLCQNS